MPKLDSAIQGERRLAERDGFEPPCPLRDKTLSRRPRYDHFGTSPVVCVATHTCKRRTASGRTARRTNHYSGLVGRRGPKAPPYVGPCRVQGDPAYEPIEQLSAISESYWPPPIFPSSKMPCDLIH